MSPLFWLIGAWALLSGCWWVLQKKLFACGVPKNIVMFASGVGAGGLILVGLLWRGIPEITAGTAGLFLLEIILGAVIAYSFVSAAEQSDASLAAMVTAFAPILVVITGYFLLQELPSLLQMLGMIVILIGTYVLYWNSEGKTRSLLVPLKSMWATRHHWLKFAIMAAIAASISIPLEKKLVLATDNFFAPGVYLLGGWGVFWGFMAWRQGDFRKLTRMRLKSKTRKLLVLVGGSFALANAAQAAGFYFGMAAVVGALKRLDGVMAVILAWLLLGERQIQYRLPGAILIALGAFLIGIG